MGLEDVFLSELLSLGGVRGGGGGGDEGFGEEAFLDYSDTHTKHAASWYQASW